MATSTTLFALCSNSELQRTTVRAYFASLYESSNLSRWEDLGLPNRTLFQFQALERLKVAIAVSGAAMPGEPGFREGTGNVPKVLRGSLGRDRSAHCLLGKGTNPPRQPGWGLRASIQQKYTVHGPRSSPGPGTGSGPKVQTRMYVQLFVVVHVFCMYAYVYFEDRLLATYFQ